jgi:hypothetical protein
MNIIQLGELLPRFVDNILTARSKKKSVLTYNCIYYRKNYFRYRVRFYKILLQ